MALTTRIKICGLTHPDDAAMCAEHGADAFGINLFAGPRKVDHDRAARIADAVPQSVQRVALVELSDGPDFGPTGLDDRTRNLLRALDITCLQLYGTVAAENVRALHQEGFDSIWVERVDGPDFVNRVADMLNACGADPPTRILLDASVPGAHGGTGTPADWHAIARARAANQTCDWPGILLAGGLTAANVATAIARCHPWGVDVSSGVESVPGRKDPDKVRLFVEAVRRASSSVDSG